MWNWQDAHPGEDPSAAIGPRILVVDDDEVDRLNCHRILTQIFGSELHLDFAATWDTAVSAVESDAHDIYLVDYLLGAGTGLDLIGSAAQNDETRIFILLTGQENRDVDIAATRAGVADYLLKKDLTVNRLERCLRYATESMRQKRQLIAQAVQLRDAKSAIEEESRRHLALTQDLKQTQHKLTDTLTRAENSERRYRWLAQHDLLTGIPNRALFADKLRSDLEQASRSQKQLALLLLDVDRFKWVNDSFGHEIGDGLLVQVADRLANTVRNSDTVARLGGDEFAVIATNLVHNTSASTAAENIIAALSQPFDVSCHHIETGVSVGIAVSTVRENDSPDEMIRRADAALYRAKTSGRGQFQYFDDALNEQVQRISLLKRELPLGIDQGHFTLAYQPKIELTGGGLAGLEALARWTHPRLGIISPGEFVPVAESTGQVIPLSTYLFEQACRTAASWKGTALAGIPIALNLSALQLKQPDLVPWILDLLVKFSLDPAILELEITETAALENLSSAKTQLNKLRDHGLSISIDDFGTGYSSLALATSLPADCLKIDLSFVSGMLKNPADAAAVDTTITLAHSLGMRTVAEGVETEEQLAYLRDHACNEAQGYLFTKPIPADEILRWYEARQGRLLPAA